MKLYERPATALHLHGRRYRLRLTYDRVLMALDAAEDPLLTDADRQNVMLGLLVRGRLPLTGRGRMELLQKVLALLQLDAASHDGPPLMSLTQDAPLIHAAFRQAYGIDLHAVSLPWTNFCELLSGLPGNTRFGEIVALRARPLPEPTRHNARERERLLQAKAQVAIRMTDQQRQRNYQRSAQRVGQHLLAWARSMQKGGASDV